MGSITSGSGCRNHADEKGGMKSRNPETKAQREKELKEFRNTERGRQAKNSKGIYYSNGNYERLPARRSRGR